MQISNEHGTRGT